MHVVDLRREGHTEHFVLKPGYRSAKQPAYDIVQCMPVNQPSTRRSSLLQNLGTVILGTTVGAAASIGLQTLSEKRKHNKLFPVDSSGATGNLYKDGIRQWHLHGKLHRVDGPASISADRHEQWWLQHGVIHREDGPAVEYADGSKEWYQHGKRHREDGPAIEHVSGIKEWYFQGKLHREGRPAVLRRDGREEWWLHGTLHRDDGPSITTADGGRQWHQRGELHREDGPAVFLPDSGEQGWYHQGKRHRDDGPAVERPDGYKAWYCNGARHREDGPARILADGRQQWWLHDKQCEQTAFDAQRALNNNIRSNERTESLAEVLQPRVSRMAASVSSPQKKNRWAFLGKRKT